MEANTEENRLQVFFDEKPDDDTRTALKSHGFLWSPNAGAWQRQLNNNALYAAKHLECLQPVSDDGISEGGPDVLEQEGGMQTL